MTTTELIEFFKTGSFTPTQAYNLLVADLFAVGIPQEQIASPAGQELIRYFNYKITEILLPVIAQLKAAGISLKTLEGLSEFSNRVGLEGREFAAIEMHQPGGDAVAVGDDTRLFSTPELTALLKLRPAGNEGRPK